MANTSAICTSFKQDLLNGAHAFSSAYRTADTFYGALYLQSATLGAGTTVYATTGEVQTALGTTGYINGGTAITNTVAPTTNSGTGGTTAYWTPSTSLTWSALTVTSLFDTVLIYNHTTGHAVAVFNFGQEVTVNGSFTVNFPSNTATTALIQLN